ncbi:23S rRNA (pseudouridine(1915)-N(3))-methyltransferase RlmH [Neptunicoccus cionae]|uniref:23S rRNA (pseudouridine(1915)-N(3))-methyltransferase RlmH n=1 Tax=Neptunicoccus cionae TaxID=2035344 RepID=UPI000C786D3F|nr:23S rRNA (pseudouridine(1915)-N(3))-methyltransferase RlmH [Amylibacter cionae]PLS22857.1 23S rRNA (pseudouridine(1915)-N(3))-methyltransferase RlmH [Amylibacter cionae]
MRLHIIAVGRLRKGPELDLISDYLDRFNKSGRALGLGPVSVIEVEDKKNAGMAAEAELLRKAIPKGATTMIMDERGKLLSSVDFSDKLGQWRDTGTQDLAILIGGADGLAPDLRAEADFALSFGKMVWPHMLVRVMLSEQLYRAASIMGNAPYHRA